jgi:cytochrome c oxidase subunit 3
VSSGSYLFAVGVLLFLVNVVRSLRHGLVAGPNPWDAATHEWATASPPPYIAAQAHAPWPTGGPPKLGIALAGTAILLAASGTVWWGERGIMRGRPGQLRLGLAATLVLGTLFIGLQLYEWRHKPFTLTKDVYGSLFFTITGFHMAHVAAGLVMLLVLLAWSTLGYFDERRHSALSIGAIYWHFVTAVWLVVMPGVLAVDAAALAATAIAGFVAWRNWRRTSGEKAGGGQGLLESGDGRTRFMAMAGMLTCGVIGVAILYIGMCHAALPECGL